MGKRIVKIEKELAEVSIEIAEMKSYNEAKKTKNNEDIPDDTIAMISDVAKDQVALKHSEDAEKIESEEGKDNVISDKTY